MTRTSRRYAEEVTDRIDRVIRSIRSQSPVLRSTSTSAVIRTTATPNLRTSYAYNHVPSSSVVYTSTLPAVSIREYATSASNYNAACASTAVSEINRIDTTCRALAAENDLLRDQVYIQTDLIDENNRVRGDLSKVTLENELLRSENRKVAESELKVNSLLRQSQEVSIQLGQQARETNVWKAKFGELEVGASRYRSMYETVIRENDRFRAEITELRAQLNREGLFRSEVLSLKSQNEELVALRLRLSQELSLKTEEINSLRVNLREIDVLSSKLHIAEQDNARLRREVANYSETTLELRSVVQECDVLKSRIHIVEAENNKLRGLVSSQADNIVELKNVVLELEGISSKITILEADNRRYREVIESQNHSAVELRRKIEELNATIAHLRVEVGVIAGLEEKLAFAARSSESYSRVISEKETIIVGLNREIAALRLEVNVIASLEQKLALAARSSESFSRVISEKETIIVELNRELAALRIELGVIASLEQKLALATRSTESYTRLISEKESIIVSLNRDISALRVEISGLNKEILSLNASAELGNSYRLQIERLLVESDELKLKLARFVDIEHQLLLLQKERESWSFSMSSNLETIRELNLKISHLEEQLFALDQLKSKVALVVAENERMTVSSAEQARIILEWSEKYYTLEKLYLAVKESTVQLEAIKTNFQNAIKETEITQHQVALRASHIGGVSGYVKTTLHDSKYSAGSDVRTAGSPTDYFTSPVAIRSELYTSPVVVKSYSRSGSPGRL